MAVADGCVQCASGSIHSPALLLRSRINNSLIGTNLRLHPVTCVFANMKEPVDIHLGQPTTRLQALICGSRCSYDHRKQ